MAKNIFVHGDFKKLRFDLHKPKGDEDKFFNNLSAFNFRKSLFRDKYWTADEHSTFLQEKYFLTKQKTLLEPEQQRIADLKFSLQNRQIALENFCSQPDSQKKIQLIAAGYPAHKKTTGHSQNPALPRYSQFLL